MRRFLIALFTVAGIGHFKNPEPFDKLVPQSLPPNQRWWTYASGVGELATAALLAVPRTRKIGGLATAALMTAVWPGNIKMALDWRDEKPLKKAIAYGRLPLQLPLIKAGWDIYRGAR